MTLGPDQPSTPPSAEGELSNEEINRRVQAKIRRMTPEEIFQVSVRAGVHNADGSLRPEYGGPPSRRRGLHPQPRGARVAAARGSRRVVPLAPCVQRRSARAAI